MLDRVSTPAGTASRPNPAGRLIATALALLALAWLVNPTRIAPLYDGLGFPDEAYRFVAPPAGYRSTAPPSSATLTTALAGKRGSIFDIASKEVGPQVELFVKGSTIAAPAAASVAASVTISAVVARSPAPPTDGAVWGNVYRVSARSAGKAVPLNADPATNSIRLRTPTAPPPTATIAYFDGSTSGSATWRRLKTERIGNDIWAAPLAGTGYYAALAPGDQLHYEGQPTPAAAKPTSGGDGIGVLAWIAGAGVVLLAAMSYAVRRARARSPGPTDGSAPRE